MRDFLAISRVLQHEATHTREKANRNTECGQPFTGGKVIMTLKKAQMTSLANAHSFSTRKSMLGNDATCAVNVENLIAQATALMTI